MKGTISAPPDARMTALETQVAGILEAHAGHRTTHVTDINSIWQSGFYEISGSTDMPVSTVWYWVIFSGHTSNTLTYRYGMMLAMSIDGKLYAARLQNDVITSSSWKEIQMVAT